MKNKQLFYLATTAVLVAASANQVLAEEMVNSVAASRVSEIERQATGEQRKTGENTGSSESASSSEKQIMTDDKTTSSEKQVITDDKAVSSSSLEETSKETEKDENPSVAPQTPSATFRSSPTADQALKTFVDVSSHNGDISKEDYQELSRKGVSGGVVKLTEATSYQNPYAASQVQNAQAAGLQVSAYAYSHYTNEEEARAEARYFAAEARRLNLPSNTVMVNDIEERKMVDKINSATQAWADEMRRLGFSNLMYYTSASWIDRNNLGFKGPIQTSKFGLENFWVAQYPTSNLSADGARQMQLNDEAGAWQFTSQAHLLQGKHVFDLSIDYTGRFTQRAKPIDHATGQPLHGVITIQNNDTYNGTFDVIISKTTAPYGIREVKVPVWSTANGQDDIIWYNAVKQSNGTYKVRVQASDHKKSTGEYQVHLYYVQQTGELVGVGGTKTTVSLGKPKGTITVVNNNPSTGTFDVIISDVAAPSGVREVKLPIWSKVNDQDDIIWYTAVKQSDGTYKTSVKASDHKNSTGEYNVHLYYVQNDGKMVGVAGTTTKVSIATDTKVKGKITIVNNNPSTGTFDVIVSDVAAPSGVREVKLPTWSKVNDQDDIIWYTAVKQADGTYKASVKASEHKNSTGEYNVHLYYVQNDGKMVGVGGITTKVSIATDTKVKGKITIVNNNPSTGTFDVIISDVAAPSGVREVKLPTWSKVNDQDDIIWYTAVKQADGTYKTSVKASDHKNSTGEYNVHLYYVQNDGKMIGIAGTTTNVTIAPEHRKPTGKIMIRHQDNQKGTFEIHVSNVSSPAGVREVKLPTWSTVNGQDDIVWYTATKQSDGTYTANVKASQHKNSTGEYNIHLYYVQNDGKMVGVATAKTQVAKTEYATPYFSQRDGRWAGRVYGKYNLDATGCVPTTLAMVISALKEETVLPTTVADYLYHSTNEFNRHGYGTTSHGIVRAAQHWGLKTDVLHSSAAVKQALSNGYHVLGAVGTSVFANYPVTHELVLKGYQDGKTYVMDPYNANNNGYYSVDYLFSVKSLDPTDNTEGSPFLTVRV